MMRRNGKLLRGKPISRFIERLRKGADLKEFKAVGTIAAPPLAVRQVLDDVEEYPRFMPYVVEAKVPVARARFAHQLSKALAADRWRSRLHGPREIRDSSQVPMACVMAIAGKPPTILVLQKKPASRG
jgi:hypothetical protein